MNKRVMVVAVSALVLAAGCGSSSSGGSSPGAISPPTTHKPHTHTPHATQTPTPTATATATVVAPPVTSTPTGPSTTAPVSIPRCLSSHLSLALGDGQGAAGTTYTPIVFTNTGSSACELHGYPGVSFVDSSGHTIGKPSSEDTGHVKTIKLSSGGSANALLRQPNPGNFDPSACQQTTADRLRVYPPGETVPLYIHDSAPVCTTSAGRTGVAPVAAGNGS